MLDTPHAARRRVVSAAGLPASPPNSRFTAGGLRRGAGRAGGLDPRSIFAPWWRRPARRSSRIRKSSESAPNSAR